MKACLEYYTEEVSVCLDKSLTEKLAFLDKGDVIGTLWKLTYDNRFYAASCEHLRGHLSAGIVVNIKYNLTGIEVHA